MSCFEGIGRLYKRDCDLEDGSGKLTVKEVVEISLALNCPVKSKTVLKYAELMARQCESHTKERKTVKGAKGVPGFPGRPVSCYYYLFGYQQLFCRVSQD